MEKFVYKKGDGEKHFAAARQARPSAQAGAAPPQDRPAAPQRSAQGSPAATLRRPEQDSPAPTPRRPERFSPVPASRKPEPMRSARAPSLPAAVPTPRPVTPKAPAARSAAPVRSAAAPRTAAAGSAPRSRSAAPTRTAPRRTPAAVRRKKRKKTSPLRFWLTFLGCFCALFLVVRLGHTLAKARLNAIAAAGSTAVSDATMFEGEPASESAPTVQEFAADAAAMDVSTAINSCAESDLSPYPELQQAIAGCDSVGFLAVDLATGRTLAYQPDYAIYFASAIKAPYALFACLQLDAGVLSGDDVRTYTEAFYDEGSGNIQYSDFGTAYTIDYLLQEALRCSDNIAYRMAVDAFGKSGYNDLVSFLGADTLAFGTDIWPTVSPRDAAKMWYALAQYLGSEAAHAGALKNVLCSNEYSPIRKALDYKKTVASKYGWDETSFCDCGIVYAEDGSPQYLVCILTTNAALDDAQSATTPLIRQIDTIMCSTDQEG